ncbi:MAG: hypothetical protein HWN65_14360 [Candidatus Helarchaeota archaeon]|nr:hypothetical protein [Candidatus Helarchaeota archaeon]
MVERIAGCGAACDPFEDPRDPEQPLPAGLAGGARQHVLHPRPSEAVGEAFGLHRGPTGVGAGEQGPAGGFILRVLG